MLIDAREVPRFRRLTRLPQWRHAMRIRHLRIPSGYCYVAGDNASVSIDSRSFGPIRISAIRGKVFAPALQPGMRCARRGADHARL